MSDNNWTNTTQPHELAHNEEPTNLPDVQLNAIVSPAPRVTIIDVDMINGAPADGRINEGIQAVVQPLPRAANERNEPRDMEEDSGLTNEGIRSPARPTEKRKGEDLDLATELFKFMRTMAKSDKGKPAYKPLEEKLDPSKMSVASMRGIVRLEIARQDLRDDRDKLHFVIRSLVPRWLQELMERLDRPGIRPSHYPAKANWPMQNDNDAFAYLIARVYDPAAPNLIKKTLRETKMKPDQRGVGYLNQVMDLGRNLATAMGDESLIDDPKFRRDLGDWAWEGLIPECRKDIAKDLERDDGQPFDIDWLMVLVNKWENGQAHLGQAILSRDHPIIATLAMPGIDMGVKRTGIATTADIITESSPPSGSYTNRGDFRQYVKRSNYQFGRPNNGGSTSSSLRTAPQLFIAQTGLIVCKYCGQDGHYGRDCIHIEANAGQRASNYRATPLISKWASEYIFRFNKRPPGFQFGRPYNANTEAWKHVKEAGFYDRFSKIPRGEVNFNLRLPSHNGNGQPKVNTLLVM
jgi:hypothetical protein